MAGSGSSLRRLGVETRSSQLGISNPDERQHDGCPACSQARFAWEIPLRSDSAAGKTLPARGACLGWRSYVIYRSSELMHDERPKKLVIHERFVIHRDDACAAPIGESDLVDGRLGGSAAWIDVHYDADSSGLG